MKVAAQAVVALADFRADPERVDARRIRSTSPVAHSRSIVLGIMRTRRERAPYPASEETFPSSALSLIHSGWRCEPRRRLKADNVGRSLFRAAEIQTTIHAINYKLILIVDLDKYLFLVCRII